MGSVWMRTTEGDLIALEAGDYAREDEFQRFLADHPEVMSSTVTPGRDEQWLLVRRELSVVFEDDAERLRWRLDHLFIGGDDTPILVEVKRSSDPRSRREVIGQMLDYAASFGHHWTAERLQAEWRRSRDERPLDPALDIDRFLDSTDFVDESALWAEVATRIAAKRLRLLFVADRLSGPVIRIIEYLNEQLRDAEVLGEEVIPHFSNAGSEIAYVPFLRGRTSAVPSTKQNSDRRTREEFDQMLELHHGSDAVRAVAELVASAERLGAWPTIGTDVRSPTLFVNFTSSATGRTYWPLGVKSRAGKVALQLRWLATHPAFEDEDRRIELRDRLSGALGEPIEGRLDGFPGFPVELLCRDGVVGRVQEVLEWVHSISNAP